MAKAKAQDASSTDWRAAVPYAITLKDAGPTILPDLARTLGATAATAEACGAVLGDDERTRARFLGLPIYQSVAAEVLVDAGGEAEAGPLAAEIARRTGMAIGDATKLIAEGGVAAGSVLVLQRQAAGGTTRSYALIAEGIPSIARIVRGVSLPRGAPPPEATGRVHRQVRDRVALATLTLHRKLRLTRGGGVHKASLKSFVKDLGVEHEYADRLLSRALGEDVLVPSVDLDSAAPSLPALAAFAATGAASDAHDRERAFIPTDRWVSLEAASRALALRDLPSTPYGYGNYGSFFARRYSPSDEATTLAGAASIELREDGGAIWIRRRTARAEETGDGHVTPSFDVLLGPGASLSLVAGVGLGAALTRVDQVLTFHIGPRTVEAGLAAGMDPSAFLAALGRVGRHGIPDNVRAMIDDWVKTAKFARAEAVLLVRVSERSTTAVAEALREHCLATLGPGRILAGPSTAGLAIKEKLERIGVAVDLPKTWLDVDDATASYAWDGRPTFQPKLPPFPEPDPAIVARYAAAREKRFAEDLAATKKLAQAARAPKPEPKAPTKPAQKAPQPPAPPSEPRREPPATVEDLALAKAHELVEPLFAAARNEIVAWAGRLQSMEAIEASRALEYPLLFAPLLALLPEYRARAYKRAQSVADLIEEAWRLCGGSRRSRAGVGLMQILTRSALTPEDFDDAAAWLDEGYGKGTSLDLFARPDLPSPPAGAPEKFAEPTSANAYVTKPAPAAGRPAPAAPATPAEPSPKPISPQARDAIRAWLVSASRDGRPVRIEVGSRTSTVRVTAARTRGHETMFLVVDTETDEGRALPLEVIRSVADDVG